MRCISGMDRPRWKRWSQQISVFGSIYQRDTTFVPCHSIANALQFQRHDNRYVVQSDIGVRVCMCANHSFCILIPAYFRSDNVLIPAGAEYILDILNIHKTQKYWKFNVHEFNPDNFAEENLIPKHPYAYMPFGGGPHKCIGKTKIRIYWYVGIQCCNDHSSNTNS